MMKKLLISLLAVLLTAIVSYGQYAPVQDQSSDYTMTDEYRHAKALYTGGIIAASVGAVVNIAGNVICVIEQNRYTNSNATSGSLEEIYQLNQEAKEQPGYRCGQVIEIAGFAGVLVGGCWILSDSRLRQGLKRWMNYESGRQVAVLPAIVLVQGNRTKVPVFGFLFFQAAIGIGCVEFCKRIQRADVLILGNKCRHSCGLSCKDQVEVLLSNLRSHFFTSFTSMNRRTLRDSSVWNTIWSMSLYVLSSAISSCLLKSPCS